MHHLITQITNSLISPIHLSQPLWSAKGVTGAGCRVYFHSIGRYAFVVGDTLRFSYGYFLNKSTISIRDINKNFDVWKMEITHFKGGENRIVSNDTETGAGSELNSSRNFFHPDHIRSEGTHMVDNRILDGKISLNRYYKNDWDGLVYYKETFGALHVFTIDCRHIIDNLDSVIVALLDDKSKLEQ